ncbi:MAG: hypothetical protein JWN40_229, partial [Phycisphaerales bacterium]|nr:hypothetical protein [Phycisphaerales bacterium]
SPQEIEQAAADVRGLGLAEIRRLRVEEAERSRRATADRAIAVLVGTVGAAGVLFYFGLGYSLLHEADPQRDPLTTWFGKKKRHGRITFGRLTA